jgi:hypothetical protein
MSGPAESEREQSAPANSPSVLANLPSKRPQRASARRDAARRASAEAAATQLGGGSATERNGDSAAAVATRPGSRSQRKRSAPPPRARARTGSRGSRAKARASAGAQAKEKAPPVPRQGYEAELDAATGTVNPPGGAELLGSAFEIVGELAKSGVSTGERLVKDIFSRLSPS